MISHHPSIEMLTDYAAGTLPLAHAVCIATHIEKCDQCRQQVKQLEELGAQLFAQESQESRNLEGLKDKLFQQINSESSASQKVAPNLLNDAPNNTQVPCSLRQFVQQDFDQLNWTSLSPAFKIATLHNDKSGSQIALTRVKAGAHMPHHSHTGDEITLVLEGAFSDEDGVYRQGDFVCRDARHKHKPIVTKDAECICLTVLDAPIEFTGWFTRLLNPLVRRHHPKFS
ncbi:ChrR family anti-sigma-E factor [Marinomonas epiphytica]